VLRIGFGVSVKSDDDPYIKIAKDANLATAKGGNPGTALVDYLPVERFTEGTELMGAAEVQL